MFKVQEIREIIRLIDQSSISEFTYENDGATLSIKKEIENNVQYVSEQVVKEQVDQPVVQQVQQKEETFVTKEIPKQQAITEEVTENDNNIVEIVSPMVGTFYRRPRSEERRVGKEERSQMAEDTPK